MDKDITAFMQSHNIKEMTLEEQKTYHPPVAGCPFFIRSTLSCTHRMGPIFCPNHGGFCPKERGWEE